MNEGMLTAVLAGLVLVVALGGAGLEWLGLGAAGLFFLGNQGGGH